MKKMLSLFLMTLMLTPLTSCYSHKFTMGEGPQTGVEVEGRNNFFLYGLIPGKVTDPQAMAGDAKDYEITEVQTFVDGLIGALTLGIYTPTTTKIQK